MGPASPNRQTLLQFIQESPDGKKLMASCVKEGVMVTPVERTNALLVQAPSEAIPLLTRLIETMDLADPRSAEIKVFPCATPTPRSWPRFSTTCSSSSDHDRPPGARYTVNGASRRPARRRRRPRRLHQRPVLGANFGTADQAVLTISVDTRTNSLLVGGCCEHIQLVAKVIEELDASPAEDRQTVVYHLRNAQATDIQTAVQQFLDQERQRAPGHGQYQPGAAKELLAREVAVVAEKTSNTLLISGSPRYFETITSIVRELDQPPAQVLINVMLAEVTLNDDTEFGLQWSLLTHPTGSSTIGVKSDVGLTNTAFNFTINSGDFSLLLRAAISRPHRGAFPATDHRRRQPDRHHQHRPARAVRDQLAGQRQRIGLQHHPVPAGGHHPDGDAANQPRWLRSAGRGALRFSSMSDSTVQISNNLNAVIIDTREAKTTVTVQDNHSVVIGGLITTRNQHTETKVPILGDIPLIGMAFKSTVVQKERTELLIILTPRVIRNVTESDVITNQQLRQANVLGQTQGSIGIRELLNPLRGVSANEVERLENIGLERQKGYQPIVIPLRPQAGSGQGTLQQQPSSDAPARSEARRHELR